MYCKKINNLFILKPYCASLKHITFTAVENFITPFNLCGNGNGSGSGSGSGNGSGNGDGYGSGNGIRTPK